MITKFTKTNHGAQRIVMGLITLGLAACDSKPTEQAIRDANPVVNRAPSPAAGNDERTEGPVAQNQTGGTNVGSSTQRALDMDDTSINLKVQDAINSNNTLKGLPIIAQTTDGVVTLSGSAETRAKREQAEQVAMSVAGVKTVDNKLTVSGT